MADHEFRPNWCPHVVGKYGDPEYDPERRAYEDLHVHMRCEKCGAKSRATCNSGQPREHVNKFALVHLHRDPLGPLPRGMKMPGQP